MFAQRAWLAATFATFTSVALAQQPVTKEKHPYEIGPEAGAWCISVTCFFDNFQQPKVERERERELAQMFANSQARRLAIDFVSELRKDYQLHAYMFNRGDEERRMEDERVEQQRKQRWDGYRQMKVKGTDIPETVFVKRLQHIQNQYMVLIGGYSDQETARRSLDAVRKLKPPSKEFLSQMSWSPSEGQQEKSRGAYVNPFKTAMVVPNPTGPKVRPPAASPEEFAYTLEHANAGNRYSPLKHGGKWTLVIRQYQAPSKMLGVDDKGTGRAPVSGGKSMYDAMAKMADQLATVLRHPQLNFESYVLHSNHSSFVTVGIFDSEKDPRMMQVRGNLANLKMDMEQLMSPALPLQIPRK